jgi:hypothetical protein
MRMLIASVDFLEMHNKLARDNTMKILQANIARVLAHVDMLYAVTFVLEVLLVVTLQNEKVCLWCTVDDRTANSKLIRFCFC